MREKSEAMRFSFLEKTIIILCFLLIGAHFVSSFFPEERLWGINHLAYFPLYVRIIIIFLGLLFLVSALNSRKVDFFKDKIKSPFFGWIREHKYWGYFIVSILFLLIFWLLRTRTFLLGDGYLRAQEITLGFEPKLTEFLDLYLHTILYDLFHHIFNWDAYLVYALVSCACGAVFVFFVLLLGDLIGNRSRDKVLIFFLLLLSGGSQLFLGYVESYTISYLGVFLFIYFSIRHLKGRNGLALPFTTLMLSIFFHASALFLFPSFLFLLLTRNPDRKLVSLKRLTSPKFFIVIMISISAVLGLFLFKFFPHKETGEKLIQFLIPVIGTKANQYSLFSLSHLIDVINQLLLISTGGIVIWIALLLCLGKRLNFRSPASQFFLMATFFSFGFALLIDPVLGYARDWDLFAFTGFGSTIWGVYLSVDFLKESKKAKQVYFALTITLLICCTPWFLINADKGRSVRRFENLLGLYERGKAYGHWTLRWFYYTQGSTEKEIEEVKKAIALEEHPKYIVGLGQLYAKRGEFDSAISLYSNAIQKDPNNPYFHNDLGFIYFDKGLLEEAVFELKKAIQIDSSNSGFHNGLGIAYLYLGLSKEAASEFRKAIQFEPTNSSYYRNLGNVLSDMGLMDEGIEQYEKAKKLDPQNPSIHFRLGACYAQKGSLNEAIVSYRRSLKLKPDYVEACYSLGRILLNTNKTDEAIILFQKATEIRPDFALAHYGLGVALARKGMSHKAAIHLERYLDLSTDTTDHWKARSLLESLKSR